jgi:sec-independent protein translocase protein TatA
MGSFSIWHWLIVLAVVLLLFGGRGKISQIMGDFGKGLKSFKKGVKDDDDEVAQARVAEDGRAPMASSPVTEPQTKKD